MVSSTQLDPAGTVYEPIADRVGHALVADGRVPLRGFDLAGDHRSACPIEVLRYFKEISSLGWVQ
jgi:hypothetical protein